ncbi:MAG: tRNA (adenosine(37)-N6)-threonylcarbamoyltransferase complex ATPase subunit type 1 TsaE, partial [Firmicutes bacterium HGW-Firmicutes-13]
MLEIITKSPEETLKLGTILGTLLQKGDVIGLFGELGTGKTVFTRGIARGLKVEDYVTSPTFTLINEYSGSLPLFHFDVYRLDDPEELLELGYEEYFYGEGITVIEWAEKIEDYLPPGYLAV